MDTVIPVMEPALALYPQHGFGDTARYVFYARLNIDTLIKGNLPSNRFWIRGYGLVHTCDVTSARLSQLVESRSRFLNFSAKFDNMADLGIDMAENFCSTCPNLHQFDGRYLRSPDFSVLQLDIQDLFPGYPVDHTALDATPPKIRVPLRAPGPAYLPDGRVVPEGKRSAVPLLR